MRHLAVLGPGLLGGSVALAARSFGGVDKVGLWARRSEVIPELTASNVADIVSNEIGEVVTNADLVVIATPVGALQGVMESALPFLSEGAVITDVCSVKGAVVEAADGVLSASTRNDVAFVGAHPMAGSELTGFANARADLFQGAACAITPGNSATAEAEKKIEDFWRSLGCRLSRMNPADHDKLVAKVSHLPHLVASALVQTVMSAESNAVELAGAGFRDTTRIAAGSPSMWTEILAENRDAVSSILDEHIRELGEVLVKLKENDDEWILGFLSEAKDNRAIFSAPAGQGD
ncbi:MAG: prephenate dehydrogenase/arogenate dehydrogenase family protein [Verrucomicrobiales bacterium]|nr:prephenate dehydrogenase/arogenate dehydrogenase family protein [Verrucomicrobiales bacterium]